MMGQGIKQALSLSFCVLVLCASIAKSQGSMPLWLYQLENWLGGDKVFHSSVAYLCSLSVLLAFHDNLQLRIQRLLMLCLAIVFALSLDELAQLFSPYRQFSWQDLQANYLGFALALLTWAALFFATIKSRRMANGLS